MGREGPKNDGWRNVTVHLVEPQPGEELALELADKRLEQLSERALLAYYANIARMRKEISEFDPFDGQDDADSAPA